MEYEALKDQARCAYQLEKFDDARRHYSELCLHEMHTIQDHIALINIDLLLKDYNQAFSNINRALQKAPEQIELHHIVASIYAITGQIIDCVQYLRIIVAIDPKQRTCIYALRIYVVWAR